MNINKIFNNPENAYFGHGIGMETDKKIKSIMNNGLRCCTGQLYFTSIGLGMGTQISEKAEETLKNWPHLSSEIIMIISLPIKYKILEQSSIKRHSAFYYVPDDITKKEWSLADGDYVMPEFVVGYYDSRNDSFTPNPKYYENLSQQEQDALFNKVKQNYFDIVSEYYEIDEYKEILKRAGWIFGLSDDEVNKLHKNKILSQIPTEHLQKQLKLPSGKTITAKQYIEEIVLPYLPKNDFIYLKNGVKIPVTHFIMECVIYDCQERYNGDFAKYIEDNVQFKESISEDEIGKKSK